MVEKATYVNSQDTSQKLWNLLNVTTSGGAGFLLYLTSRKAPFPRFVILANGGIEFMEIGCQGVRKWIKFGNHWARELSAAEAVPFI